MINKEANLVDLHIHSAYSMDGELPPAEIAKRCMKKGLRYFSIADHDTVRGIEEARLYCADKELRLITGVELDCTLNGLNLHLLGYGIDDHARIFKEIEDDVYTQEAAASKERIARFKDMGFKFDAQYLRRLSNRGVISGEMIGKAAMQSDRERKNPLLMPYYEGEKSVNAYVRFYWDFCSKGKPGYVPIHYMNLRQAVRAVHESGGLSVLAHPGQTLKENAGLLREIIRSGVDGIETYSSYHTEPQNRFYRNFALENGLFVTCGSDYHGWAKPAVDIGGTGCPEDSAIISGIIEALNENR